MAGHLGPLSRSPGWALVGATFSPAGRLHLPIWALGMASCASGRCPVWPYLSELFLYLPILVTLEPRVSFGRRVGAG
jgi:hypothetical protein